MDLGCKTVPRLQRTPLVQREYDLHRQRHFDLHGHILDTYLHDRDFVIVPNMFPLHLAKGISQHILWMRKGVKLDVAAHVATHFRPKRTVLFENPDVWKSIPTIPHHHIFVEDEPNCAVAKL